MKRPLLLVLGAALLLALLWLLLPRASHLAPPTSPLPPPTSRLPPPSSSLPPPSETRSTLADTLNSPATDIHADLRVVLDLLEAFRTNFPHDGNPVGTNSEITATLSGANRLRLAILPRDHPAINSTGELCDRWGTPFFFHAESASRMEIRSAGPDKKLWTDDDILSP